MSAPQIPSSRVRPCQAGAWRRAWLLAVGLWACAGPLSGQLKPTLPAPSELKKLSVEELMDIEVSSVSKHPEKLFEAASAIQVITADDVRRAGARSLPEALRLASNLEVAQIDSRQWAITARGFNNVFADKMLVLIDGRTVYTPLYAGVYWDVQSTLMEDLDRIEVISGPGATQWGANAVNGVINITTKSAKDTQGGLLTTGAGDFLHGDGAVRYGGRLAPNVYYRVYGKLLEQGDSRQLNGQPGNDEWRLRQGGLRVDWESAADTTFTLQGDAYDGRFGRTGPDDIGAWGRNLLGRWSRTLAENSDLRFQVYYDHTSRIIPASFTQTLDTYDFDFQHRFPLGRRHDITWGAGYRVVEDGVINTPANAFLPPQVTRQMFSTFVQDSISLDDDRLHLTLGTKLEHNDYTGFELEPSIRAAWTPAKNRTLWAAVSRAVRTPSRIDRDLFSPATPPYRVSGGPSVVSEKLVAWELGYRQALTDRLALALATFYNDYNDLRSLEPLNPPAAFPIARNSGLRGHSSGAELTMEWRVTDTWRLHAGYTELRVHTERQPGNTDLTSDRNIARDPNRQLTLRSQFDLSSRWEFDSTARYVGPINNQVVPGYTELDLRLGWHPTSDWAFSLAGQNLLHAQHAEFNVQGGRREIARSVYGQVTWSF
ncbi:TonB-dependent receptor [Opitutus sp. GAS368]|uniref:TonB-dependent receptor plug domain-containing protein n=1 Tax=Opitutus sp. GAS368 TaxID=1882749 RepID=UPI00087958F3|nr:TonB-dependent receptor [Opitutus sp. GAS368]SDR71325.1 iron complex outermembrane recepter protein [Opitutus sp. GAS368]